MTPLCQHWDAEALWQKLVPLLPGLSVEIVPSVASTNTALLDRASVVQASRVDAGNVLVRRSVESGAFGRRAVDVQPTLYVAERQIAGRGRLGRGWESAPAASLTFSLGLPMAVTDWSGLSLAVGVALAEAVDPSDDLDPPFAVGLKWPNDLWLMDSPHAGRKLGGVLIETVAAGAKRLVVVGVGLNVQPFRAEGVENRPGPTQASSAPRAASNKLAEPRLFESAPRGGSNKVAEPRLFESGFASVHERLPGITAPALLARVALPLVQALKAFERDGFGAFAERFARRDVLRGRVVRSIRGEPVEGIAEGVSACGALLLRTADGLTTVSSGEVSVRPLAHAPARGFVAPC